MSSLTVRGLEAGYGGVPVLWGLDVDLLDGALTGQVGISGSVVIDVQAVKPGRVDWVEIAG